MTETIRYGMAIPDAEYDKIVGMITKRNKPVRLEDKSRHARLFYLRDGKLFALSRKDNQPFQEECMKLSDIHQEQLKPFADSIKPRIRKDHPDWPEDVVDAYGDILSEANESIKNLIKKGIDPNMAHAIVSQALNDDEAVKKLVSGEITIDNKE